MARLRVLSAVVLSFVFLLGGLPAPAGAQGGGAEWKKTDDSGDTAWTPPVGPSVPTPWPVVAPAVDLTEFSISDPDSSEFVFVLKTAGGFRQMTDGGAGNYMRGQVVIHFQLPGDARPRLIDVDLQAYAGPDQPADYRVVRVSYCVEQTGSYGPASCWESADPLKYEMDSGVLSIHLPKDRAYSFVVREYGGYGDRGTTKATTTSLHRLVTGDQLTKIYVSSTADAWGVITAVRVGDRLPDAGDADPYSLQHAGPLTDLGLELDATTFMAGEANTALLHLVNRAPAKRYVEISYEVTPANSGWDFALPSAIIIDGNRTTNLTVQVTPSASDPGPVRFALHALVRGESNAFVDHTYDLLAQFPLDATHNKYYVHAKEYEGGRSLPSPVPSFWGGGASMFISRIEDDPAAADAVPMRGKDYYGFQWKTWDLSPLPNTVSVNKDGDVHYRFVFDAPQELDGQLSFYLMTQSSSYGRTILQHSTSVSMVQGENVFEGDAPMEASVRRLARDEKGIALTIEFHPSTQSVPNFGLLDPTLRSKVSYFTLPVEREIAVPPPVGLPQIRLLNAANENDEFVNTGHTTVFEADLTNQENKTTRVFLDLENRTAGWTMTIEPATRFTLGPHESVRVGVLVSPDTTVPDNTRLDFALNVADYEHEPKLARLAYAAIVTNSVPIADKTFSARENDAGKFDSDGHDAPGAAAWGTLIALVAVAAFVSGRRRNA